MDNGINGRKKILSSGWLVPLGGLGINGLIVLINLVASSGYVPKSDFNELKNEFNNYRFQQAQELSKMREDQIKQLAEIAGGIKELNGRMQDNVRQDAVLKDHEDRIRAQEHRK